jgi:hypothetical protein
MKRAAYLILAIFAPLYALVLAAPTVLAHGDLVTIGGGQREEHHGYFRNIHDDWGDEVFPNGMFIYNANDFIARIRFELNSPQQQYRIGARFIVDTMLGLAPANYGPPSAATLDEWERRVRALDRANGISWNEVYTYERNTYYQGTGSGANPVDVAMAKLPSATSRSIVFRNSSGAVVYAIKHDCANPVGTPRGLPDDPPPPPPTATFLIRGRTDVESGTQTGTSAAFSAPITVRRGDTVTFRYYIRNIGPNTAPSVNWRGLDGNTNASIASGGPIAVPVTLMLLHTETFTVPATAVDGDTFCRFTRWTPISDNDGGPGVTPDVCARVDVPEPIVASCGGANVLPTDVDSQTNFTVSVRINYGSNANAVTAASTDNLYIRATNSAGVSLASSSSDVTPTVTGSALTGQVTFVAPHPPGSYTVYYGMTGPTAPIACTGPLVSMVNKPYLRVNGGDVSAGAGMSTGGLDCASGGVAPNPNASIVSWNRGAAGSYNGAGTQFGASVLNHLMGFVSGQGSALAPSRLSFGNTGAPNQVNPAQELYGGKLGNIDCTADYFANATSVQTGNVTIGGQMIANGTRQTRYVDGNVYITGNIVFAGATAGYPNIAAIPAYSIIVRGNIYVAPGVTQLDGFYVAQPSNGAATNGIIYSCAPSGFGTNAVNVLAPSLYTSCGQSLTVNGAFAARQVWLLRTAGSISTNTAAETFNYSPDVWLSAPFGNGLAPRNFDEYDSIEGLPPVL